MIRLGSLAGYPFEGPRLLAGWTPPGAAAVYAIAYKSDPAAKPDRYAVIYVGHSDDLAAERFPFQHPRAHCWIKRAGSKWKVYICTYKVPGGGTPHREQIARELTAVYRPRCNDQQYDQAWKDEWIGSSVSSSPGLAKDPLRPWPQRSNPLFRTDSGACPVESRGFGEFLVHSGALDYPRSSNSPRKPPQTPR